MTLSFPGGAGFTNTRTPDNQRPASEVLVSTPCRAVKTRGPSFSPPVCWNLCLYRKIYTPGKGPCSSRVALAPRTAASQQSTSGVGVLTPCRGVSIREATVSSPVCWTCTCIGRFLIQGLDLILPGWRWIHEPLPISNQPVRLKFPHRARRYGPGERSFFFLCCKSCR